MQLVSLSGVFEIMFSVLVQLVLFVGVFAFEKLRGRNHYGYYMFVLLVESIL